MHVGEKAIEVWRSRRARRALGLFLLIAVLGPVILVLPLRFLDPPLTAMILWRTLDRRSGRSDTSGNARSPRDEGAEDARGGSIRRRIVSLNHISPDLRRAVLIAEDDGFYAHHGFDVRQIKEAISSKRGGRRLRGASTISQQTAKNLFLWSGRSFVRKGLEAYFTFYLELLLPKDRILEIYLNLVECAEGVFGVEAGARHHFKKSAGAVTPEEAARLAAILPNPRKWSPFGRYASERAERILEAMERPRPHAP